MRNRLISLAIVGATYPRSGIQDPGSGIQDLGWPESLRGGQGRKTISQLPINRPMAALPGSSHSSSSSRSSSSSSSSNSSTIRVTN